MNNSKSGLVGVLSFLVLSAASLGVLGVASRSAGASPAAGAAPVAVVRDAAMPTVSFVVVTDEVTVEGRVPARRQSRPAPPAVIETSSDVCYVRPFDDGNDTSVRTCTPVDMLVMQAR